MGDHAFFSAQGRRGGYTYNKRKKKKERSP